MTTQNNRPANSIPVGKSTYVVPPKRSPACKQDRMWWVKQDYLLGCTEGYLDKKKAFNYAESLENTVNKPIL
jgi:hypothetical protein